MYSSFPQYYPFGRKCKRRRRHKEEEEEVEFNLKICHIVGMFWCSILVSYFSNFQQPYENKHVKLHKDAEHFVSENLNFPTHNISLRVLKGSCMIRSLKSCKTKKIFCK